MRKRKFDKDETYNMWMSGANKLDPPYDYFSFTELANTSEMVTNSSYCNIMVKALAKASRVDTVLIIESINTFKACTVPLLREALLIFLIFKIIVGKS